MGRKNFRFIIGKELIEMVAISNVPGCCIGTNLYNLGGAHGHALAKTQEEFDRKIFALKSRGNVLTALINNNQFDSKLKSYLEKQGWNIHRIGNSRMYVCSISNAHLRNYLEKYQKEEDERLARERAKKEEMVRIEQEKFLKELRFSIPKGTVVTVEHLLSGIPRQYISYDYVTLEMKNMEAFIRSIAMALDIPTLMGYYDRFPKYRKNQSVSLVGLAKAINNRLDKK